MHKRRNIRRIDSVVNHSHGSISEMRHEGRDKSPARAKYFALAVPGFKLV